MDEKKLMRVGYKIGGHEKVDEQHPDLKGEGENKNDGNNWINPRLANERIVEVVETTTTTKI